MAQETNKIIEHIETERGKLGEKMEEFESRIKHATNPKTWYDNNPALVLGAAAAGGLLLGYLSRPSQGPRPYAAPRPVPTHEGSGSSRIRTHVSTLKETADTTLGALIGLGARKFQDLISRKLPGFQEQYDVARRRQAAWDSGDPKPPRTH